MFPTKIKQTNTLQVSFKDSFLAPKLINPVVNSKKMDKLCITGSVQDDGKSSCCIILPSGVNMVADALEKRNHGWYCFTLCL